MLTYNYPKSRSCRRIPSSVTLGVFFLFTFWNCDNCKARCLLCCCKKRKKTAISRETNEENCTVRKHHSVTNSVNWNINDKRSCFTLGGKRNCELPPVPISTATACHMVDGKNADVVDGNRPYSFCEPSESDPLYASVGLPDASATARNRPEAAAAAASTAVAVAANSLVTTTKKADFWNAVDSEGSGGSLLPYYSSILHDTTRSSPQPHLAAAVVTNQSPAVNAHVQSPTSSNAVCMQSNDVYAVPGTQDGNESLIGCKITLKRPKNIEITAGPPIPSRAYRLSEVERLFHSHQYTSTHASNPSNQRSRRPRSEVNFSGQNLLDLLHSGLRRRQLDHDQADIGGPATCIDGPSIVSVANAVVDAPIVSRISGDYSSNAYGSARSGGHYRNITVRESIASLRARDALPAFLSGSRRSSPEVTLEADYEGVYWYPGEGEGEASRVPYDSQVVVTTATDIGSDAYVEIPDRPRREEIYAEPTEHSTAVQSSPPVRSSLSSRILLEMQDFRYVDSETDLSSSVTPPETVDEGGTKESGQTKVNGAESMPPSASDKLFAKLRRSKIRMLLIKPKVRKSQNMAPLMEISMETEPARLPNQSPSTKLAKH